MRILAVPLARRPHSLPLLTFIAQSLSASERNASATQKRPSMFDRLNSMWINLGRSDVRSLFDWRRRVFLFGERLMDLIEYEEWALKGIDTTAGPSLRYLRSLGNSIDPDVANRSVPVYYSSAFSTPESILNDINKLSGSRAPHHRKYLALCAMGIPITAPFTAVPVIPNFPMYYLIWRTWSHYNGMHKANQHIWHHSTCICSRGTASFPRLQIRRWNWRCKMASRRRLDSISFCKSVILRHCAMHTRSAISRALT